MATSVDICNLALSSLGDPATVTSLNPADGSAQAGHCARWFPIALRRVYEEFDWSFATRRESLNEITVSNPSLYLNKKVFALPANYVKIIDIFEFEHFGKEHPVEFDIEFVDNTTAVITNAENPIIKYIKYSEQTSVLPGYFIDCVVPLLASMLVGSLKRGDSVSATAQNLLKQYQVLLSQAKTMDSNKSQYKRKEHISSSIHSRGV